MAALVSLTFDDGLRCQFDKALPILNQYKIPATFFLIANKDATHEPWDGHKDEWWKIEWSASDIDDLKQSIKDGHEIGSHSVSHRIPNIEQNPVVETQGSKRLIEDWLGTKIESFCYPYYRSPAYLEDAVKSAGYGQARGGAKNSYYSLSDASSFDRFNVDCREISPNEKVPAWVHPGYWHVLTFHGIGGQRDGWKPISVDDFSVLMQELAAYRDAGTAEILTFKEAATRF